jgi:tRNA pseudouridine38-40 synthase
MKMRTLKLTIAYDGTRYAGWQVQAGGPGKRQTIQGVLERVLRRILQEPVRVIGSGRTDAGVHAAAQVAHVRIRGAMPRARLFRSINQLLPPDIAVLRIEEADASFHARFDATGKRYRYRMFLGPVAPPFVRPYVHHVRQPLDLALMRREAQGLRGRHDFAAFARRRPDREAEALRSRGAGRGPWGGAMGTKRLIRSVSLRRVGGEAQFDIEGEGFLHTMVRSLAGTLIDVGRGRLPRGTVRRLLRKRDRALAGATAPAQGLTLVSVAYGDAHG